MGDFCWIGRGLDLAWSIDPATTRVLGCEALATDVSLEGGRDKAADAAREGDGDEAAGAAREAAKTAPSPSPVPGQRPAVEVVDGIEAVPVATLVRPARQHAEWVHVVTAVPADFDVVVARPAFQHAFPLDSFQRQAIYYLERGESVFVAAHTSAGKTAVAEYALALALQHCTRALYTAPIKALSNQKFRDLSRVFGERVGLLTGDVQVRPEASLLIMTTEILRSMLYRGAEVLRDVEFVVFDEVHYVNDAERGVVWEEVLIMLPPSVTLVLLSATLPNCIEFAEWVGRTRRRVVHVVTTSHRPVPLEHHLWLDREPLRLVDAQGGWVEANFKTALGKKALTSTRWGDVVGYLRKKSLLPAVVFCLSRRRCEENIDGLGPSASLLNSGSEQHAVHVQMQAALARLSPPDAVLPQIVRMQDLLSRGLAVHHSGLLPVLKEVVEILFSQGLVRLLFATETFAMGVNMPARTVLFAGIRKHDGRVRRDLAPGEYIQMAGRAGRRGIDARGTVVIVPVEGWIEEVRLKQLLLGKPSRLASQFRLTYPMILNLLLLEGLRVEEMMRRSFAEHAGQRAAPLHQAMREEKERMIRDAQPVECALCEVDLGDYWKTRERMGTLTRELYRAILRDHKWRPRVFHPGRVLVANGQRLVFAGFADARLRCQGEHATVLLEIQDVDLITNNRADDEEADFGPFSSLEAEERRLARKQLAAALPTFVCSGCPELEAHLATHGYRQGLCGELAAVSFHLSEDSLALLPEYRVRVAVLKALGCVDEGGAVTLKGRVAAQINTVHALIVTELLFDNVLGDYSAPELLALLSAMVFQERTETDDDPGLLSSPLQRGCQRLVATAEQIQGVERDCGLQASDQATLRFGLVPVVHEWMAGRPFADIMVLTEVLEGVIVRCITRLDETCRELKGAAKIMGDPDMHRAMEDAGARIKRDICFTSSLYI